MLMDLFVGDKVQFFVQWLFCRCGDQLLLGGMDLCYGVFYDLFFQFVFVYVLVDDDYVDYVDVVKGCDDVGGDDLICIQCYDVFVD